MDQKLEFTPVGTIRSCFREKFGIPRQAGLVPDSRAVLKFNDGQEFRDALRGLEGFSHVWIVTVFHGNTPSEEGSWKPLVRPPRLGGTQKVGVFASRSPHRPNPIGLSAVKLEKIVADAPGGAELHLRGIDFLDGTPVLDVKPYVPYSDSIPEASSGWATPSAEIRRETGVEFTAAALQAISDFEAQGFTRFRALIEQVIQQDPRPSFQTRRAQTQTGASESYGCRLYDFDVRWKIENDQAVVVEIEDLR
ncbi:MAG: tRNA (N6-threonylcarbamoyladenosine(37)-N6)-methyltransferase TrmO [Bdellovibrionales bacterium GWB1_55_8]|nr:MAG: tRNA (N6-threonylcarbamoyladenosine(37)-N6)-methyltransferase TrmO [Bdellovibrionales bacterium GWB1_55_8]